MLCVWATYRWDYTVTLHLPSPTANVYNAITIGTKKLIFGLHDYILSLWFTCSLNYLYLINIRSSMLSNKLPNLFFNEPYVDRCIVTIRSYSDIDRSSSDSRVTRFGWLAFFIHRVIRERQPVNDPGAISGWHGINSNIGFEYGLYLLSHTRGVLETVTPPLWWLFHVATRLIKSTPLLLLLLFYY